MLYSMAMLGQIENNLLAIQSFFDAHPALLIAILVWSLFWKGFALWKAAQLSQKVWFVIILIVNTAGILEIIYLYFVARKYTISSSRVEVMDVEEEK